MWTCPKCKEQIEDQFDACWNCAGEVQRAASAPTRKKPLEFLEFLFVMIALMPGLLMFSAGRVQNHAQAVYRICVFVVGVLGFIAVKLYQRRKMRGDK
jgi:nitrate reductase NapE component